MQPKAKYDEASNLVSSLQAKLEALKALGDEAPSEAIKQLRSEIMAAKIARRVLQNDA